MRLDKLISECGLASRSECGRAARSGQITVNGIPVRRADEKVDPERDHVVYCGTPVVYRRFVYLMLNKPDGYISATEDGRGDPVVTDLLPTEFRKMNIFPCGRLDKHTLGLMLLTNDGVLAHKLLAPKSHVTKSYRFSVKFPLSKSDVATLEAGVDIGGYVTKPCQVVLNGERDGVISITEGKYHQIKLMMEAVHNQITYLERLTFGQLLLDERLLRGQWRELTAEEIQALHVSTDQTKKGTHISK